MKHIPSFDEFESSLNESSIFESAIEIVHYQEVVDNWGRTVGSEKPSDIEKLLKSPDEWTDDQTFTDKLGKVYFIDDLIDKQVKVNGKTFKVVE